MTKVIVSSGTTKQLTISGHSGYAESGADIVCSAISILAHSFCSFVAENERDLVVITMDIDDGYVDVLVKDYNGILNGAMRMLELGMLSLEENYPHFLSFCRLENQDTHFV